MSEVRNGSHWAKIKVPAEIHSFLEVLEKNLFPCFLQVLDTAHIPLLINLSIFKVSNGLPSLSDDAISLLFWLSYLSLSPLRNF